MTQEILDYCLTKAKLLALSTEEILESVKTKEQLECWCASVIDVIECDCFLMVDQSMLLKIRDVVSEKRFLYPDDPFFCHCFNEIIDFYNSSMNQDEDTVDDMTREWLQEEIIARQLPRNYMGYSVTGLLAFNYLDYGYLEMLLTDEEIVEFSAFPFLSTLNWVLSLFPEFFEENKEALDKARNLLAFCEDRKSGTERKLRKVAKLTQKRIDEMPNGASNGAI